VRTRREITMASNKRTFADQERMGYVAEFTALRASKNLTIGNARQGQASAYTHAPNGFTRRNEVPWLCRFLTASSAVCPPCCSSTEYIFCFGWDPFFGLPGLPVGCTSFFVLVALSRASIAVESLLTCPTIWPSRYDEPHGPSVCSMSFSCT